MAFFDPYDHNDLNLIYTPENIPTTETQDNFDEEFSTGCECREKCTTENNCTCLSKSGAKYITIASKFQNEINDSYIICKTNNQMPNYECNAKCKCAGILCQNRLVQFGPRRNLKTSIQNGKGLGLTTEETVRKGNFICEYAGEVIAKQEAIRRHEINEKYTLMNYIFCLNEHFGKKIVQTFIDPSKIGNIGRYINHSCQPNCELIPVRVNNPIPKLCIFAVQDIDKNTELTFDYGFDSLDSECSNSNLKRIKCLCGAAKCRMYMPFCKYTV